MTETIIGISASFQYALVGSLIPCSSTERGRRAQFGPSGNRSARVCVCFVWLYIYLSVVILYVATTQRVFVRHISKCAQLIIVITGLLADFVFTFHSLRRCSSVNHHFTCSLRSHNFVYNWLCLTVTRSMCSRDLDWSRILSPCLCHRQTGSVSFQQIAIMEMIPMLHSCL